MRSTTTRLGAVALASGVLVTALAGSALAQDAEGNVVVSGSSTVEPISLAVAEEFNILNPNWTFTVEGPGTTAGFEQFCNGEIDIADASRAIREEEVATCNEAGCDAGRAPGRRSTASRSSRTPTNEALDLPELRRPVRDLRPGV